MHFQSALDILDDVLQKDLFLGVLPHFKILVGRDELIFSCIDNTSVLWYIKQLLTDACFYIPALMLTIFVPVRLGHYFFPLSGPVVFRTADVLFDYDVPLETILFHILVPFMAEKIHYRKITTYLLENFFKRVCRALDLIDYLSESFREGNASCHGYLVLYCSIYHLLNACPLIFEVNYYLVCFHCTNLSQYSLLHLSLSPSPNTHFCTTFFFHS